MKSTERLIQTAVYWDLYQKGYMAICPNYTPKAWLWECDMFSLTRAKRFVEHEIKISRSDFKADALKSDGRTEKWNRDQRRMEPCDPKFKHKLLEQGSIQGPSRFFYVVPEGLVTPDEIPPWSGLMYFYPNSQMVGEIVSAPKLHDCPMDQDKIDRVMAVFYYRFWTLRNKAVPSELEPEFSI